MTMWSSRLSASLLGLLAVALAGCAGSDRTATANNSSQVSGQSVAAALQTQLAKEGVSGAQVSCAKNIIVTVGPKVTCGFETPCLASCCWSVASAFAPGDWVT